MTPGQIASYRDGKFEMVKPPPQFIKENDRVESGFSSVRPQIIIGSISRVEAYELRFGLGWLVLMILIGSARDDGTESHAVPVWIETEADWLTFLTVCVPQFVGLDRLGITGEIQERSWNRKGIGYPENGL